MPKFKFLDDLWGERDQWQSWTIDSDYASEKGSVSADRGLAKRAHYAELKQWIAAAEAERARQLTPQSTTDKGVQNLKEFHMQQSDAARDARRKVIDDEIRLLRSFLRSQKMWTTGAAVVDPLTGPPVTVMYDTQIDQKEFTRVDIVGGQLVSFVGKKPLDTGKMSSYHSGVGTAVYVMSQKRNLHVHSHVIGNYHHSSLLGGAPVFGAGEIKIANGTIKLLTNKSGHYQPKRESLYCVLSMLQHENAPLDFAVTEYSAGGSEGYNSVEQFMIKYFKDDDGEKRIREAEERLQAQYEAQRKAGVAVGAMVFEED